MTSITHALIGVAIANKIGNPWAAGAIALTAHFICDMIPHWDWGTNHRNRPKWITGSFAIAETLIALFIGLILMRQFVPSFLILSISVICSLLPDWLEAPYHILNPNAPKWMYWIYKPQSIFHSRAQLPWGMVTQVITVGIALWWGFGT